MLTRLELAELVHEFARLEGRAIDYMHPRDLDALAECKQRLCAEALTILNDHKRLFDHPMGFFTDHAN